MYMDDINIIESTIQKFEVNLLNVFERSLLCSPSLQSFVQKYIKTVILWNIISNNCLIFNYTFKIIYSCDVESEYST